MFNLLCVSILLTPYFMDMVEPFVAMLFSNTQLEICTLPVKAAIAPPRPTLPVDESTAELLMNLESVIYAVAFAFTKIAPPSAE